MALTLTGNRTGRAASIDLAEQREWLTDEQAKERTRQRAEIRELNQFVRDSMTQAQYDAWWASTPDDNAGYDAAVLAMAAEIATARGYAEGTEARNQQAAAAMLQEWAWDAEHPVETSRCCVSGGEVMEI